MYGRGGEKLDVGIDIGRWKLQVARVRSCEETGNAGVAIGRI